MLGMTPPPFMWDSTYNKDLPMTFHRMTTTCRRVEILLSPEWVSVCICLLMYRRFKESPTVPTELSPSSVSSDSQKDAR